ncbi:MAG: STAS domain-containing protein [Phycisphaerae bacterium]|nr:STAS domain-containing protein [Phycisphaerae bacterium]MDW8261744.1 STAS domain-containing protein [Phycisphaerales bacterium]
MVPSARIEGNTVFITVDGDVDARNSPELRETLIDLIRREKPKKLILNLGNVRYMDSSAIAVLVESLKILRGSGGSMILTNLQPRVKGLLEIARLQSIFAIAASEAEALSL